MPRPTLDQLKSFFRPRNIALVGASDSSAWSNVIFSRFAMYGHQGDLFAVNRSGSSAHGLPGFSSIGDIPSPVDMAYIYVPAATAADAVRQAAAAGIRNAVVLSSGFAEAGEKGKAMQAELAEVAEQVGMLMLGPNSLGFANIADNACCTSIPTRMPLRIGRLGIVSQSGAVASQLGKFAHVQGIGLSFIGATGNEAHLGVADLVEFLVHDPGTGAIALYVEAINDPLRFAEAARHARLARKPIVILKLGRSSISAAVGKAHTGSLVGDDRVFDAMCRRYGVVRVSSIEELIITADFLEKVGPINPPRVGMASISGGACAMYADLAHLHGLDVSPWSPQTQAELRDVLPDFASTLNPLDITGAAMSDPALWSRTISTLSRDPRMGLIIASSLLPNTADELAGQKAEVQAIVDGYRSANRPPILCSMTLQDRSSLLSDFMDEVGLSCTLPDLEFGVRALAHLQRWSENLQQEAPARFVGATEAVRPESERDVLSYLASKGAPVIPSRLATSAAEAVEAVTALGGAAVLKIASPDILHKTEARGVRLNVVRPDAARIFEEIVQSALAHAPNARIDGVTVSPMREPSVELIVGVARDPVWGLVIVVGLGGIFTEALQDSQVRLLPVSRGDVKAMLAELRGAKLLEGFRGAEPADLDKLADAVVAIGDAAMALGPELAALEVNPLRVRGGEIECLDALAVYSKISETGDFLEA